MPTKLPAVDVLLVGFGWTGAIMAQELTGAGLEVLAIERGNWRDTPTDFPVTFAQDELRYSYRHALFQDLSLDTLTMRNKASETALPMRQLGSFLLGSNVGGAGVHWNGQSWRFLPVDFKFRSHNLERYGRKALPAEMTVQDWGVSYAELEPYYDKFEYLCGISGKAGNLRGVIQPGGNPFEGPRAREYPTPPMRYTYGAQLFSDAAREQGYQPFPQPSGNLSEAYTNPLGAQLAPCTYCGFCERFGCGNYSKATPQTTIHPTLFRKSNFRLKTGCEVLKVNLDAAGKLATGVTYVDTLGREFEQPAAIVVLCAYSLNNVRLLLVSGVGEPYDPVTGKGQIGRNYSYQITSSVDVFFDDKITNPFIGAGALASVIDEFNGDNFDHGPHGFIGGGYVYSYTTNGRPIQTHPVPDGTPKWGSKWKKAVADNYLRHTQISTHGGMASYRDAYLDLDPTYRDVYGRPLLRMTFDFHDNELKLSKFLSDRAAGIARAMNGREISVHERKGPYSLVPYQTTHNTGGAIMGTEPGNSAVNTYLQSWDVSNLFVTGACAFPQNAGYNPTLTVAALAYRAADAIKSRYLHHPGSLA
jgi:gluconate 2-dehydrogenase alpha chain